MSNHNLRMGFAMTIIIVSMSCALVAAAVTDVAGEVATIYTAVLITLFLVGEAVKRYGE